MWRCESLTLHLELLKVVCQLANPCVVNHEDILEQEEGEGKQVKQPNQHPKCQRASHPKPVAKLTVSSLSTEGFWSPTMACVLEAHFHAAALSSCQPFAWRCRPNLWIQERKEPRKSSRKTEMSNRNMGKQHLNEPSNPFLAHFLEFSFAVTPPHAKTF